MKHALAATIGYWLFYFIGDVLFPAHPNFVIGLGIVGGVFGAAFASIGEATFQIVEAETNHEVMLETINGLTYLRPKDCMTAHLISSEPIFVSSISYLAHSGCGCVLYSHRRTPEEKYIALFQTVADRIAFGEPIKIGTDIPSEASA